MLLSETALMPKPLLPPCEMYFASTQTSCLTSAAWVNSTLFLPTCSQQCLAPLFATPSRSPWGSITDADRSGLHKICPFRQ